MVNGNDMLLHLLGLVICLPNGSTVNSKSIADGLNSIEERSIVSGNITNLDLEAAIEAGSSLKGEHQTVNRNGISVFRNPGAEGKVVTDIENINNVLDSQLEDMNSEIKDKIASSIESKSVDRSRFRDIFVIKKRVLNDGERRIVKYDIDERLIPKYSSVIYQLSTDTQTKVILILILMMLIALVFTTTIRLYDSLIKYRLFQKCDYADAKI